MTYERPAVERRVEVASPVIAGITVASPVLETPTWVRDAGIGES